ncbi:MAG: transglutaminase domain protein [Candidatus Magnetoglobus multicellularis str. Araruama]|uniref:Transglutaminase domain protein n=1 Tax=Candidatus Magnetoglobus multicellularis str. Araruama TaxID=890399 RepID=A0A1V1PEW0_9BACT|nr:MAG: transglutaminase domain protein [Candidatus Magnetoglobus multicellularis str. Araruama]
MVYLDQKHWISYNPDGTYEEWNAQAVKIMSEKGKRQFQTISSYFTIPYNTTSFKRIVIICPDNSRIPVDIEKNSRVTIEHNQMKKNIYNPNQKILRVSIPQLNIGDVLYTELKDIFSKVRTPDTWGDYIGMESVHPIIHKTFEICAPVERPLERIVIKNEIMGTISFSKTTNDSHIIYQWIVQNVPQAFPEPDMPPMYSQIQRLLVSTVKDWEDISRWYWQLCKAPIQETTPEMRETVQGLIKDTQLPMDKIKKIFFWVSQQIRYLGLTVEKEAPGYEPHPVNMTFERRAGVCRDKAALLVSMLRLAGFKAYPVLIMNGPKKDPEVPQPFFNHAISCVLTDDGDYILMDATDENTRELFPTYLNDQSYLVARPDGDHLRLSPVAKADENLMIIQTKGQLNEHGHLSAKCQLRFEGINDNAYRGYFSRIPFEERKTFLEKLVKNIAPAAQLTDFSVSPQNMQKTDQPLTITIHFNTPDIRIQEKDTIMLPVFQVGTQVGIVRHLIGKMGLKKRKYPLKTHYACGVKEHLDLDLGDSVGQLIRAPGFSPVDNQGITYDRSMSVSGKRLTGSYVFRLEKPEYSTDEYQDLLNSLEIIEQNNKKMPIFGPVSTFTTNAKDEWYASCTPDAIVLSETVHYDIKNKNQWTEIRDIRIKVLTYAGIKRFSDIQIPYQPSWENVHIKNARVMRKDGVTKINPDEMNTMDAPWAGDAPRYLAAKTLVVSFPGVEIGSVIDCSYIRNITYQPFFSNMMISPIRPRQQLAEYPVQSINSCFRYRVPVEQKIVKFSFPCDMRINFKRHPAGIGDLYESDYPVIKTHQLLHDKILTHSYMAEKMLPIRSEQYLPPWYSFNPLVTATSETWQNFAQHLHARMVLASLVRDKANKKAGQLTQDLESSLEKITAIRNYVAENIRLIPIEIDNIDIRYLSDADKTLDDGYGHAMDRAILLYAMLQYVGLSPDIVLVSSATSHKIFQEALKQYPSFQWCQDILIKTVINHQPIYLNDTDQYAVIGVTGYRGRIGIVLPDGNLEEIVPQNEALESNLKVHYTIDLKANGSAIITQASAYFGMDHAAFHKKIAEMPPEKRTRYHQQLMATLSQASEMYAPYHTHINTYPAKEQFSVTVDSYAVKDRNYVYLEIPGFSQGLAGVRKDSRTHPLYRPFYSRKDVVVSILAPENCHCIISPKKKTFVFSADSKIESQPMSASNNQFLIRQHVDIGPLLIGASHYDLFLDAHNWLSHMKSRMVLFDIQK